MTNARRSGSKLAGVGVRSPAQHAACILDDSDLHAQTDAEIGLAPCGHNGRHGPCPQSPVSKAAGDQNAVALPQDIVRSVWVQPPRLSTHLMCTTAPVSRSPPWARASITEDRRRAAAHTCPPWRCSFAPARGDLWASISFQSVRSQGGSPDAARGTTISGQVAALPASAGPHTARAPSGFDDAVRLDVAEQCDLCRLASSSGSSTRAMMIFGMMPTLCSSLTECCVGFCLVLAAGCTAPA